MTLENIPGVKGRFPFRVGTSSYIIPDDILPNVTALAPLVDDIELLLFEIPEMSNVPSPTSIQQLRALADQNDLTFTVHLPLDLALGRSDSEGRLSSVEACRRMINATRDLMPLAYLLHVDAVDPTSRGPLPADNVAAWSDHVSRSINDLLTTTGVSPRDLCVETLAYRFEYVAPVIDAFDLGVCLDIGHILLYGFDLQAHLDRYMPRTRVIHAHGIRDGKDHCGLDQLDPAALDAIVDALSRSRDTERVFTMEVFSKKRFEASMRVMHSRLADEKEDDL